METVVPGSNDTVSVMLGAWVIVAERNSIPLGVYIAEYNELTQVILSTGQFYNGVAERRRQLELDIIQCKEQELKQSVITLCDIEYPEIVSHKVTNPRLENSFMYKHHSLAIDRYYGLLRDPRYPPSYWNLWTRSCVKRAYYHDNIRLRSAFEDTQRRLRNLYPTSDRSEAVWAYHGTSHDTVDKIFKQNFSLDAVRRSRYGPGIYFSEFPQVALHYTSTDKCPTPTEKFRVIILCKILPGLSHKGSDEHLYFGI